MYDFLLSQSVKVKEGTRVIDSARVVAVDGHVLTLLSERLHPGNQVQMAYMPELDAWKVLFEGLHGENCINPRGSIYSIQPNR